MRRKVFFGIVICLIGSTAIAQQLPLGECGIVCTYDAAGNRLRRLYYCNNGGVYPTRIVVPGKGNEILEPSANVKQEYQMIDAIFPNPTSGIFHITFSKELKNAIVTLSDLNGRVLQQFTGNGYKLTFDLSKYANGSFIVQIKDEQLTITKKIIKL